MLNISGKQNWFGIYPKSFVLYLKELQRRIIQNNESPRLNSIYTEYTEDNPPMSVNVFFVPILKSNLRDVQ